MTNSNRKFTSWLERKRYERGIRARERQLEYQEKKSRKLQGRDMELLVGTVAHAALVKKKIEVIRKITPGAKILEVGAGAHGIVFGFGHPGAIGIDPLAADYHRLFPKIQGQESVFTAAAIGEELPFADSTFDLVLSDNVIDHAEKPLTILDEIARVIKPSGLFYFTVNVHHPLYQLASNAHGAWNALGIKIELSAFADHTIHFTEKSIWAAFEKLPFRIIESGSTVHQVRESQRRVSPRNVDQLLKKFFFKNALFEAIAERN